MYCKRPQPRDPLKERTEFLASATDLLGRLDARYVYPFYKPGAEPEKVLGADERMYSQCKRIQIATGTTDGPHSDWISGVN